MSSSIAGCVLDAVTGQQLSTPRVSLTQRGVLGETLVDLDEQGRFAFESLTPGTYSIGFYSDSYAPLYRKVELEDGAPVADLRIELTPGAFLGGQVLDEEGNAPLHCHFTLIRMGEWQGVQGYISDSGDHAVGPDGRFLSPPLYAGSYCLRFQGILQKPHDPSSLPERGALQLRNFDFVYPDVQEVKDAVFFDVQVGQRRDDLELRIPRPVWRVVRGRLTGALPEDRTILFVFWTHCFGMVDDPGGSGTKVDSQGTFEMYVQPGRHKLALKDMTPPSPERRLYVERELGTAEVFVAEDDVDGIEIQL